MMVLDEADLLSEVDIWAYSVSKWVIVLRATQRLPVSGLLKYVYHSWGQSPCCSPGFTLFSCCLYVGTICIVQWSECPRFDGGVKVVQCITVVCGACLQLFVAWQFMWKTTRVEISHEKNCQVQPGIFQKGHLFRLNLTDEISLGEFGSGGYVNKL